MNKIGFIGTGNLTDSIIRGLVQSKKKYEIFLYDLLREKADLLAIRHKAKSGTFSEVVKEANILILAVKPKDIRELLIELAEFSLKGKLIIAVAAGTGLSVYEEALPEIAVVRVMPNTSSAVLHSASGLTRGKYVTEDQSQAAEEIFTALGKVLWVEDSKMNAVTAVSGSGPAYFYLFTEFMVKAGIRLGLSEEEAGFLAAETLAGAGKMLAEGNRSPQELREAVTSPNGTTYAAINVFRQENLEEVIYKAMDACYKRAEEMEGEYSK